MQGQPWVGLSARRRWALTTPDNVKICVSASESVDTGKYSRPSTGIGQARSLAVVAPNLTRGWRSINLQQILFPSQLQGHDLETDLILIGGPRTNSWTQRALELLADSLDVGQEGWVISAGRRQFEGEAAEGDVAVDYGLVVRAANPFSPGHRVVILSGSHTYGTVGAARFAVESPQMLKYSGDVAFVVSVRVAGGHVLAPELMWSSRQ